MLTRYGLPLTAAVLLAAALVYVLGASKPEAPPPPPEAPPRNPYVNAVAGTGIVEPQTENIAVGATVPGVVVEVFVRVNQKVNAGDPLFRQDDRELQAMLRLRKATLAHAEAELTRLKNLPRTEDKPLALAKVTEAEENLSDKLDLLNRGEQLLRTRAISDEEQLHRRKAYTMAKAQLDQAKAQYELLLAGTWKYDLEVARRMVEQAQVQVDQVTTDLDRLVVRALVDAEVLQVNVRPGEFVGTTAGQAFVMLGNVTQLHIRASIDEHDIPRFRAGAPAEALLRGKPEEKYALRFVRVEPFVVPKKSLTGENTERVDTRVLQVIYAVEKAPQQLYVGQQVDVFIDVQREGPAPRPAPAATQPSRTTDGATTRNY
jgi:multidrug resistance efflux pump